MFYKWGFQASCERFGVNILVTTPQQPSGNRAAERLNINIKKPLAIFPNETNQWDNYIWFYTLIYNNSIHSSHNKKPAYYN